MCVLFLIAIGSCYCQQVNPVPKFSAIDYRTKAKNQKTGAWLLLGSGAIVFFGTVIDKYSGYLFKPKPNSGKYLAIGGTLMAVSIPVFIISGKNKEKAKSISTSVINERVPILRGLNHAEAYYSALSIKFSF